MIKTSDRVQEFLQQRIVPFNGNDAFHGYSVLIVHANGPWLFSVQIRRKNKKQDKHGSGKEPYADF